MGGGHRFFFLLGKWLYVGLSVRGSGATGLRFCTAGAAGCSWEVLTLIGSQEVFLFLKTFSQCKSTGSHSIEAEEVPLSHPGPGGAGMWWSQKHAHPGVRSIGAARTCSDSVSTSHAAAAAQGHPARRRQARPCLMPAACFLGVRVCFSSLPSDLVRSSISCQWTPSLVSASLLSCCLPLGTQRICPPRQPGLPCGPPLGVPHAQNTKRCPCGSAVWRHTAIY